MGMGGRMHVLRRTYKYRLYPTRQQATALAAQLNEACRLYNAALDERRSAWRMQGVSIGYLDQANQLKGSARRVTWASPTSRRARTSCGGSTRRSRRSSDV